MATPTLNRIFDAYQDSARFEGRAPRTRDDGEILDTLRAKFGDVPISALNERGIRSVVFDGRDEYGEDSARQADYHVAVFDIAMNWAFDGEWPGLDRKPFAEAGKLD